MIIVFDADNTLYDFLRYFAPYFRSAVHIISKETGIDEDIVISELRKLYQRHGTVEYQFVWQESNLIKNLEAEKFESLKKILSIAARQVRSKNLVLYSGVKETLEKLFKADITCIALTNAPFYQIDQRFNHLNLHKYFNSLLCAEGGTTSDIDAIAKYDRKRKSLKSKYELFIELSKSDQKPSVKPYEIVRRFYKRHDRFIAIGDSLEKDLRPARSAGFETMWAKYGTQIEQKDLDTILGITPWTKHEIRHSELKHFEADFVLDKFVDIDELLNIPYQRSLF